MLGRLPYTASDRSNSSVSEIRHVPADPNHPSMMWLLDVSTYELKACVGRRVWEEHPYAILSHTWGDDEVSFEDMADRRRASRKAGFRKIKATCERAAADGLRYAWVDTCCVRKTSSAELQEAINSMFGWYARAARCYAYLGDVGVAEEEEGGGEGVGAFRSSRWFTRGWTLQELIAPAEVLFFDRAWVPIATRSQARRIIARRTGIDERLLDKGRLYEQLIEDRGGDMAAEDGEARMLSRYSVAQRMSWAAGRETTRVEDEAYCLLGMFGISMPLLYGEGRRAFDRLQEEVLRVSRDLSIFLWEPAQGPDRLRRDSLFASSPHSFATCGAVSFQETADFLERSVDMVISSVGVRLNVPVLKIETVDQEAADSMAILSCFDANDPTTGIALKLETQREASHHSDPDSAEASSGVVKAVPYSELAVLQWHGLKRTARVDVLKMQDQTSWRQVLLMHGKDLQLSHWDRQKNRVRATEMRRLISMGCPSSLWLRFDADEWRIVLSYPKHSWDLARRTVSLEDARDRNRNASGSQGPVEGACVLKRSGWLGLNVIITFKCTKIAETKQGRVARWKFFFDLQVLNSDEEVDALELKQFCDLHSIRVDQALSIRTPSAGLGSFPPLPNTRLGPGVKAVSLPNPTWGTQVFNAFAVKPELRLSAGKEMIVLHAYNLRNAGELQLDDKRV